MHAYNFSSGAFREITSAITPANLTIDEDANLIAYVDGSTRKVYSFSANESRATDIKTKTIPLNDDQTGSVVRYVAVTYKSGDALTLQVWLNNEIDSGDIRPSTTYYNNGYTSVTYNAVGYNSGQTFTGVAGKSTYAVSGTGTVELYKSATLAANNTVRTKKVQIRDRASKIRIQITSSSSANAVEIDRITIYVE